MHLKQWEGFDGMPIQAAACVCCAVAVCVLLHLALPKATVRITLLLQPYIMKQGSTLQLSLFWVTSCSKNGPIKLLWVSYKETGTKVPSTEMLKQQTRHNYPAMIWLILKSSGTLRNESWLRCNYISCLHLVNEVETWLILRIELLA